MTNNKETNSVNKYTILPLSHFKKANIKTQMIDSHTIYAYKKVKYNMNI